MKKIAILAAFAALALVGCKSPGVQYCEAALECSGEKDPAGECADQKAEQDEECADDDDCKAIQAACQSLSDAWAACLLENSECKDEVFGDADTQKECEDQAKDVADCAKDAV